MINFIKKGNAALKVSDYSAAMKCYTQAIVGYPDLAKIISANISYTRKKYQSSRSLREKKRVVVCCWDLSHNAAGRAYMLAELYKTFADVEMMGFIFPALGKDVWEPIRTSSMVTHSLILDDESQLVQKSIALVAANPCDIVHLSKPRFPNIVLGFLYKIIWGSKVIFDIDDEELAFVGAAVPDVTKGILGLPLELPNFRNLHGREWTEIAVSLVNTFDAVTVSNPVLQMRYSGVIIRHARNEKFFYLKSGMKVLSRKKFDIHQDKKVILFFGTPRRHKGLIEVARLIARLNRDDLVFVIVGNFDDNRLKSELVDICGKWIIFFNNQPFDSIPDVLGIADLCVLYQDPKSEIAANQVPAKLTDALAMEVPVLATSTLALKDIEAAGAFMPITVATLERSVIDLLYDEDKINEIKSKGRLYFESELSFKKNASLLKELASSISARELPTSVDYVVNSLLSGSGIAPDFFNSYNK